MGLINKTLRILDDFRLADQTRVAYVHFTERARKLFHSVNRVRAYIMRTETTRPGPSRSDWWVSGSTSTIKSLFEAN